MSLFFSIQLFPEEFIHALNWTLLHSLWQGILLSIAAGGIVFFTKRTSPALRYNLLTGALFVFIIVVASTFSYEIMTPPHREVLLQAITSQVVPGNPAMLAADAGIKLSISEKATYFINTNGFWIVLTWLLIMCLRCIRLTAGLYGVYRLKKIQVFDAGAYWNNRISELSVQLHINKRVRLLRSGLTKVPAVVGYFSPVILFPASMLTSLDVDEVEAILLHELAHIRRRDFLVNILQSLVEIILFFNLPVLWVSSLIRTERENCCDDIAVIQTGRKRNYINALLAFGELNLQFEPSLANTFAGKKNHLTDRVKRILYNNNKTLSSMEKKFLAAGVILTGIFIFAFSSNIAQQKKVQNQTVVHSSDVVPVSDKQPATLATVIDTIPSADTESSAARDETIYTSKDGKSYKLVLRDGHVKELYVDLNKIPAEKIDSYKPLTEKIIVQSKLDRVQLEKDMMQSKEEMLQSQKDMEASRKEQLQSQMDIMESQNEMEESKRQQAESLKEMAQAKIEMEQSKKEMQQQTEQSKKDMALAKVLLEKSKRQLQQDMEQSNKDMEQSKKQMQQDMEQRKKEMAQARIQLEQSKKDMTLYKEHAQKEMEQSKKDIEQSRRSLGLAKHEMEQSKKTQEEIIGDFIKENIIKDKKDLSSYQLSNDELVVNGIKQSAAIHKKFKDKYVKGNNWTMQYNNHEK